MDSEAMTSRKKQSIETRNRIFECATDLFARESYEKVKISDICHAAGVSTGAFYHYFATKENILNEGYRDFDRLVEAAWKARERTDRMGDIRFLIRFQLESISANGYIYAMQFFKNQLSNEEKYILNPDRFFYQTLKAVVAGATEIGELRGEVFEITEAILRVSRGTIYDWCLHEGSYEVIPRGISDIQMVLTYYGSSCR